MIKRMLKFIWKVIYTVYYVTILYINFLENLLIYPIFFVFFGIVKYFILAVYHLCYTKYYFYTTLLFLYHFWLGVKYLYRVFKNGLSIQHLRIFNVLFKNGGFTEFYNDTTWLQTRNRENYMNRYYYMRANRRFYNIDFEIDDLKIEEDDLINNVDTYVKPGRCYYINDFYRDERYFEKASENLVIIRNPANYLKNRLLLDHISSNVQMMVTMHRSIFYNSLRKGEFPKKGTRIYANYEKTFLDYTTKLINSYVDYQYNHINVYIKRRAYLMSIDYMVNHDWYEYGMTINYEYLNNSLNQPFTDNSLIHEFEDDDFDENFDLIDEISIDELYKDDVFKFNLVKNRKYYVFYNDFLLALNYNKLKQPISFRLKLKAKYAFYRNYFYYFLTYLNKNYKFFYLLLTLFVTLLYKCFMTIFRLVVKLYKKCTRFSITDYLSAKLIDISLFKLKCKKELIFCYRAIKIILYHGIEKFFMIPLIQINYFYCFVIIKSYSLFMYFALTIINYFKKLYFSLSKKKTDEQNV